MREHEYWLLIAQEDLASGKCGIIKKRFLFKKVNF